MTDEGDPLLGHLRGEVERIERLVDRRLAWPSAVVPGVVAEARQVVRWSYRFTWQEVERGRRYVLPLPAERAIEARRLALSELCGLAQGSGVVGQSGEARIRYRAGLNVYEISCSLRIGDPS